jgi:hypothetical protein
MRTLCIFLSFVCLVAGQESNPGSLPFLPVSEGPYHVTVGDVNNDGIDDTVLACRGDLRLPTHPRPGNDQLSVYLSQPDGTPVRRDYTVGFGPYTSRIADLDSDGYPDVAVVNFQEPHGRDLSILWGRSGDGPLSPAVHLAVEGGPHPYEKSRNPQGEPAYPAPGLTSLVIADFDRDGLPDIAAVAWSSDFLVIFRNEGKRRFSQRRVALLPGPRDLVAADFDGDGNLDLAVTIYSCNLIEVLRGDGKGHFTLWQRFHSQGHIPYHLQAGDVDGDGRTDLVVGNRGPSDDVAYFRNTPEGFRHHGSFRTKTVVPGETTGDEIRDVFLTDVDGDGTLDLLAAGHVSHKVILWKGTGDVRFGSAFGPPHELTFAGKGPRALARTADGIAVAFYDTAEFATIPWRSLRNLLR